MLFLIVAFVLCLPLVLFALSNTEMVRLGMWPTDYSLEVHLSLAILVAMAFAFLLGANGGVDVRTLAAAAGAPGGTCRAHAGSSDRGTEGPCAPHQFRSPRRG